MEFFKTIASVFTGIILSFTTLFGGPQAAPVSSQGVTQQPTTNSSQSHGSTPSNSIAGGSGTTNTTSAAGATGVSTASSNTATGSKVYTDDELLAMGGNTYASGEVPLGDYKYVTTGPKKGYIYLCNVHKDNPGSMVNGPWMGTNTWNFLKKVAIQGSVAWPQATFSNVISGAYRILTGNDLPVGYKTGVFPVASSDPAHQYDANPNTISAQTIKETIPANPTYSDTPYCMGGEVGIMTDGVALFDGFDAGLRDAPAHELQDSCDGHPQGTGEYHYHSLSACFKDISEKTVLGYAFDGFPITGPEVATNKFLTTDDLDECHGITSEINENGKKVTTYHYVMTQDFPYSASCFRGKPSTLMSIPMGGQSSSSVTGGQQSQGPQSSQGQQSGSTNQMQQGGGQQGQGGMTPPQAAIDACASKSVDASCSFTTPNGTINGSCRVPPNSSLACVPS